MDVNGVNIDWLGQEVLLALDTFEDGGSDTSEIREHVGLGGEQPGRRIKHRFERLEEAGCVETNQPMPENENEQWPPKEVHLTSEGRRILDSEQYPLGVSGGDDLKDQVERAEMRANQAEQRAEHLEKKFAALVDLLGLSEGSETSMPSVLQVRAGYAGVDKYFKDEISVDVSNYAGDVVFDEIAELDGAVETVRSPVPGEEGEDDSGSDGTDW